MPKLKNAAPGAHSFTGSCWAGGGPHCLIAIVTLSIRIVVDRT
jgi:hypothetical protein